MSSPGPADPGDAIGTVLSALEARRAALPPRLDRHAAFVETYRRTTAAVAAALREGRFEDAAWVEAWDVAFADLYLVALDADLAGGPGVPRPWQLAFEAPAALPALRHLLLGMNAHINYDLPQALLAVISDEDFASADLLDRRRRDHELIDTVLAARVAAEDDALRGRDARSLLDRALQPLNRLATRRFLPEARRKVWHNTVELQRARQAGPGAYVNRLAELEVLSAARIADLLEPGQVLVRLAVAGFGVTLPPEARGPGRTVGP